MINELHGEAFCTEWMHGLLEMVENNMLVVSSKHRMTAVAVLAKLQAMYQVAQTSDSYCIDPRARLRRSRGSLAERWPS